MDNIYGRNSVLEALRSGANIDRVMIANKDKHNKDIVALAHKAQVDVDYVDKAALDKLSNQQSHQGVMAQMAPFSYVDWQDMVQMAKDKKKDPLILICDHLKDPQNLGAIMRSALCFGVDGIVIPNKRSVRLTPAVLKTSAGAAAHIPVAKVSNLVQTMEEMKKAGIWVAGTDMEGESVVDHDGLTGPLALVIGDEEKGMSRLVRKTCDFVVSIPMESALNSLNVSVATGVVLYEAFKKRAAKA